MDESSRSGRARWTSWAQAAALGLGFAACSCGAAQGNSAEVDLGRGDSTQGVRALGADGDEGRSSGDTAARRKAAPLPAEFSSIGKPCPEEPQQMVGEVQVLCGRDKRIAALWKSLRGAAPALPEPVLQRASSGPVPGMMPNGYSTRVHLDGEHLWIASACVMCRVPMESLWIGDLSLVTDEQLGQVQAQAGLPQRPALRDEKAWKAALAKSAGD